jgi:hypothetical protein
MAGSARSGHFLFKKHGFFKQFSEKSKKVRNVFLKKGAIYIENMISHLLA